MLPPVLSVTLLGKIIPVNVNVLLTEEPAAAKANCILDVLTVRLGGGGVGEFSEANIIQCPSCTVHHHPII
jgi:hypothetical protein